MNKDQTPLKMAPAANTDPAITPVNQQPATVAGAIGTSESLVAKTTANLEMVGPSNDHKPAIQPQTAQAQDPTAKKL